MKMLQANPNSYEGHRLMGQLALLDKDLPKGIAEMSIAYQIDNKADLALPLFQALVQSGRAPEAEKTWRATSLAREKTFGRMYDLLYAQYMRTNRTSDAEQLMKLKVENNPAQSNYILQLVAHYYISKRFDDMDAALGQLTDEQHFPEGHLLAGDFFFFSRARIRPRPYPVRGRRQEPAPR